ncbi:MAG: SDR family oxidoreductase [Acidobacteria bacterium]|nr:SDR family oxidoreductase [Acidobacteriota bacterium]
MSNPWRTALVTGASSGIGAAIARELAAEGVDLVLVARRADRLDGLATEMRDRHGVQVEVLSADLSDAGELAMVEARLADEDRPIDLLVNNAGIGNAGAFAEIPLDREDRVVRLNVLAPVRLTRAVLPGMIARGRGGILNVSSVSGIVPQPFGGTYAAGKAFVTVFTEGLAEELGGTGVRVSALCPGYTRTEFHERRDAGGAPEGTKHGGGGGEKLPEQLWMTAERVAKEGLRGLRRGRVVVIPGLAYQAVASLSHALPRGAVRRLSGAVTRLGRGGDGS